MSKIPDNIMDKIIEKFNSTDYSQSYQHRIVAAEFGYSLAAEELARYQAELMEVRSSLTTQKELKTILNLLIDYRNSLIASNKPVGNINLIIKHLQTKYIEAEALSFLPGKQEGEIEGQDEVKQLKNDNERLKDEYGAMEKIISDYQVTDRKYRDEVQRLGNLLEEAFYIHPPTDARERLNRWKLFCEINNI